MRFLGTFSVLIVKMHIPDTSRKYTPEEKQQLLQNLDIEGADCLFPLILHLLHKFCLDLYVQSNIAFASLKNGSQTPSRTFGFTKKGSFLVFQNSCAA